MRRNDISSRMMLAAVLPVTLISIALALAFLLARVGDNDEANNRRARSLIRQVAAASEYGLFAANFGQLQSIALAALREPDVRSVTILDARGTRLASAGKTAYTRLPVLDAQEGVTTDPVSGLTLLLQPISASEVKLDDLFEPDKPVSARSGPLLGHVVLEFSRQSAIRSQREMLWTGAVITLIGMLLGCLLAIRLGRAVLHPVLRVSSMVERIGGGDLSARVTVAPSDPLHDLQQGLNQMAERLETGRDQMEQRIQAATSALREKKEEAETATLAKSRFLAAASHDLRQPMHALGMFVARLGQLSHDDQTKRLISSLELSVQAMQDLLDGLLDISRLDANAVQVQVRPFPLADVFKQLALEMALPAADKGLRLRVRPTRVAVLSDSTLLHRVLLNLVSNAVSYTQRGGVLLACRVAADASHAYIEVWDSGIGIAAEHQEAIFNEFYQVGNTERDRRKGLGLGLNIVRRTLALLGHRLDMWSHPGLGTRFRLQVPLSSLAAVPERRIQRRNMAVDDLAGLHILVIEDDALARDALVSLLSSWGTVAVMADGLAAALTQLQHSPVPDLIISDYRLRDNENGIETVRQLRVAVAQPIPACLLSGDTDPGLMQAAQEAGLTLLHKPVRPAKLRSLIRRLAKPYQAEVDALM